MKIRLLLLLGILALTSCDANYRSSVPNMRVQYTLFITRDEPHFVVENGFQTKEITEKKFTEEYIGYSGLLIWVGMDQQYHAADLCCPACVQRATPVEVDGLFAVCPLCGEKYDLSYGFANPTQGNTKEALKRYSCTLINGITGRELIIRN